MSVCVGGKGDVSVCVCGGGGRRVQTALFFGQELRGEAEEPTHKYPPLLQVLSKIINRISLQETHNK